MKWPFRKSEERSYTDAIVDAMLAAASNTPVDVGQLAAAEFGAGLVGRAFALAQPEPEVPLLTPVYLESVARSLMLRGNSVAAIDVSLERGLDLLPALDWDIVGGPSPASWLYRLELAGPSRTERRAVLPAGVIHHRIGQDSSAPWQGRSALQRAGHTAKLASYLESRMSEEATARTGHLLPIPKLSDDQQTQLKADLRSLAGQVAIVESTAQNFGGGPAGAPLSDWLPKRFGATIPAGNLQARTEAAADVLASMGIPRSLWVGADGGAMREGYRLLLTSLIQPLGHSMESELREKLGINVRFNHDRLAAADVTGKARAVGSLVAAGMPLATALQISNLGD